MFIIRNHDFAADLYYYAGTKDQPGRYGWGPEDLIDGKASRLVEFELREEAWSWLDKHENFSRGSVAIPLPGSVKQRGRPTTGKAMTPAERKRAQRERDRAQVAQIETETHKAAPRILAEALNAKDHRAFLAWLEMGERAGWLNSYDRGQILKHNTPKA